MKKHLFITLTLFAALSQLHAQDSKTFPAVQLYIVTAGDKELITDCNGLDVDGTNSEATQKGIVYINPAWIDTISIIKGKDAVAKYGAKGENGVVLMQLKKDALSEMPEVNRKKFIEIK